MGLLIRLHSIALLMSKVIIANNFSTYTNIYEIIRLQIS